MPTNETCPHNTAVWIHCEICALASRAIATRGFTQQDAAFLDKQRSCAICTEYTPLDQMIEKPDGRAICPTCSKRIERLARKSAQQSLFGQQSLT